MSGYEIDMRSEAFRELIETNQDKINAGLFKFHLAFSTIVHRFYEDSFNRVLPISEASGSTAANIRFGIPSFLNVNSFTYSNATGMPLV